MIIKSHSYKFLKTQFLDNFNNQLSKKPMFSQKDKEQFSIKGITEDLVEKQIKNFNNGFPCLLLKSAATKGYGIIPISTKRLTQLVELYNNHSKTCTSVKFVPASGAASRMFKDLFSYIEDENTNKSFIKNFITNIYKFAFYNDLKEVLLKNNIDIDDIIKSAKYDIIIENLLLESGLNYGNLPKGVLKFHKYGNYSRTPIEEHIIEGINYSQDKNKKVNIHFTISPEHKELFTSHINKVSAIYEKEFNVQLNITFSVQKSSTDTIAVDIENKPFRNHDNSLLFRPAGHGALIENLNDIDADIIFIKNIDNVVPDKIKETTFQYKKALAGILIETQKRIFNYIEELKTPNDSILEEIEDFLENDLCIHYNESFNSNDEKINYYLKKLNRPIRVCGMVKNEGEPGGGPFWAFNNDNSISLQIVESSQIDFNNNSQKNIASNATHFNPVDIVCSTKNHKEEKFNLKDFVDEKTGFISVKSKDGKDLKAQELPGLWNGAMSDWNTIFVEVPIITFNPVKTINDLIREEHLN